jgi:hypothetical protein
MAKVTKTLRVEQDGIVLSIEQYGEDETSNVRIEITTKNNACVIYADLKTTYQALRDFING